MIRPMIVFPNFSRIQDSILFPFESSLVYDNPVPREI
jgi:hypothetical protein